MTNYIIDYQSHNGISYMHSVTERSQKAHSFYRAESHTFIELLLVLSGAVDYSIDGAQYSVNTGDLIIINAGEFHSSKISHLSDCERINLHFSPTFIPVLTDIDTMSPFTDAHLYQHVLPQKLVKTTRIKELMQKIAPLCAEEGKYRDLKIICLIQELIVELHIAVERLLQDEYRLLLAPKVTNELFQEAISYINSNITSALSASEVADALGISESYLHRLFKTIMGISICKYITNQKMQLALSLLRKGRSAQNVAEYLGYEYYATFFTQFMRVFGKPPTQLK